MALALFHVSEEPGIEIFRPRPIPVPQHGDPDLAVWAVDGTHLANYLLPRDCPRVTFSAGPNTTEQDISGYFDNTAARRMIVVEQAWLQRIVNTPLHVYEIPPETFSLRDANAGYYISSETVRPRGVRAIALPTEEIMERGHELRFVPNLWSIRDGVISSTLNYSIIRMRNAQPRP
jgi:hypothetical protein